MGENQERRLSTSQEKNRCKDAVAGGIAALPILIAIVRLVDSYKEGSKARKDIIYRKSLVSNLPSIVVVPDELWFGERETLKGDLEQQLAMLGLGGLLGALERLLTKPKKVSRRTFLELAACAGGTLMAGQVGLFLACKTARVLNIRGAETITKNPVAALLRAIGKALQEINQKNEFSSPFVRWKEAIITDKTTNLEVVQVPLEFPEVPIFGPSFVNIVEPLGSTSLHLIQPSQINPVWIAASIEKMLVCSRDPEIIAGMSFTWGWPLEHADVVRVVHPKNSHPNLSARYGAALPYWTPQIIDDDSAMRIMEKLSDPKRNPYYLHDLSYRSPDPCSKFQQIVCYSINSPLKLVPLEQREEVINDVRNGRANWAIQCHLTIASRDVKTQDLELLEHMLDEANFRRISFNGIVVNPDTGDLVCVTTPLSIPLNPRQIYEIADQIASHYNWGDFIVVIGDQGGATGTFYKATNNKRETVIRAGICGWVPNTERLVLTNGEISHPPNIISHTHSLCFGLEIN